MSCGGLHYDQAPMTLVTLLKCFHNLSNVPCKLLHPTSDLCSSLRHSSAWGLCGQVSFWERTRRIADQLILPFRSGEILAECWGMRDDFEFAE
jgi:hypothetical protein